MVDLLHLASVETLTWKPPEPPVPPAMPKSLPAAKLCAVGMVLQWAGFPAKPMPTKQSADYLVAMHELVRRIAQIKTTEPSQTPSVLLPQLQPEVENVIQAQTVWRTGSVSQLAPASDSAQADLQNLRQEWQTCAAQWLWWIAQSSHEMLRLLEGCPAQTMTAGASQTGSLRLVVGLTLDHNETMPSQMAAATASGLLQRPAPPALAFDLVTGEAVPPLLAADQQIRVEDSLLAQPTAAGHFLQRLTQQILEAVPTLRPCFEGLPARWLLPARPWQLGMMRISLGLAFSPFELAPQQKAGRDADPTSEDPNPEAGLPQLTFSQPNWLEQHVSIAVAQQLTQMFLQQPPASDAPEAVLAQGCAAIEQLQASLTLASRIFAQQSLPLNELALRLQWGINRTAYEVMQLTSGLAVRLLQPQQLWQTGRLRLVIFLRVRTPDQQWTFDVVQRSVTPGAPIGQEQLEQAPGLGLDSDRLSADGLVQTAEHDWCVRPVALEHLEAAFWQQVEQAAPEIALLRSDTEVMVATRQSQGELGVLRLEVAFEFVADPIRLNARQG